MTKQEEAVENLKEFIKHFRTYLYAKDQSPFFDREQAEKDIECFHIAIKSLENQSTKIISREQAIQALKDHFTDEDGIAVNEFWDHKEVIKVLENLSPVIVLEPEWIPRY